MKKEEKRGGPPVVVGGLLRGYLKSQSAFAANPIGDWSEIVGEAVARHSQPVSLKKGVLVIVTHDSVWKHHLELLKDALADKINGRFPEPLIEKIVLKVGEVPKEVPSLNPLSKSVDKIGSTKGRRAAVKKKRSPARPLTDEEKQFVKNLSDPDLRAIASRLLKHVPLDESSEESPDEASA